MDTDKTLDVSTKAKLKQFIHDHFDLKEGEFVIHQCRRNRNIRAIIIHNGKIEWISLGQVFFKDLSANEVGTAINNVLKKY